MSLKQKIERKRFDILMSLAAKVDVVSEFPEELWAEIDKHVFEGEPLGRLLRRNNDVTTRYERSYALSLAFDKCNLVRGTLPRYGKILDDDHDLDFINGWVEDDQYVYDPTFMKRFDKNFYYYLFDAKVLRQITSEELAEYYPAASHMDNYNAAMAAQRQDQIRQEMQTGVRKTTF